MIRGTLDYLLREMRASEGGLYSAQDAESWWVVFGDLYYKFFFEIPLCFYLSLFSEKQDLKPLKLAPACCSLLFQENLIYITHLYMYMNI